MFTINLPDIFFVSNQGSEKSISGVLEKFIKWLRRDDINLEENRDHEELAREVTNYRILEKAE